MKISMKKFVLAAASAAVLGGAMSSAQAANWLMLQGTERPGAAPRAKVWGFIQPEYQHTDDTKLQGGGWAGQKAIFNQMRPDLKSSSGFNVLRARLGVRGTAMPLDSNVNYFLLAEFGNNGVTRQGGGSVKLTDASVTFNHFKGARVRVGQFKYPGSEEGLQAIHVFDYINFSNVTNGLLLERFFDGDGSTTPGNAAPGGCGTAASCANNPNGPVGAFRDVGIQVFETFKQSDWEHSYAFMIGNGNGITRGNDDNAYDTYVYLSTEKVYGGKGPRRMGWKFFAWGQHGKRTLTGAGGTGGAGTHDRKRAGLGTTFRNQHHRFAFEYVSADGMIFNGTDGGAVAGSVSNNGNSVASWNVAGEGEASGYYVHYGFAPIPKIELDVRYDYYDRLSDSTSGERVFETATFGIQYFFNKKTRMILNYENRRGYAPNYFGPGGAGQRGANAVLSSIDNRMSAQVLAIF